ncbi:15846_t:CDS:2, partial [Acaulospora colombiana]
MSAAQPNGIPNDQTIDDRAPPVVGINFGPVAKAAQQDYAPDCIANEDGERQIATALSFYGEEVVRRDTSTKDKNLRMPARYTDVAHVKTAAAPVIDHQGEPSFNVQVLEPAPAVPSLQPTPRGSHAATPLQSPPPELAEPTYTTKNLTVSAVATIVIQSLVNSAADFLGQRIQGAVITVPTHFSQEARQALRKSAEAAGVHVLQLLDDAAAASLAYSSLEKPPSRDRTSLILDLGASALDLTLLSIKQGLAHSLASSHTPDIGGDAIDDKLVAFFAKEFTKKTKVQLSPTSTQAADLRALTKLRLAVEHTKRTLSASPGAAACSVESLKDGLDFSGTINRLRFDVEMKGIYAAVADAVKQLLESLNMDNTLLDEVILVGGTALLPGLTSQLANILHDSTEIRSEIDPSQVLSRGAAVQAGVLASLSPNDPLLAAFEEDATVLDAQVTTKALGIYLPQEGSEDGSSEHYIQVIAAETPLPARRTVSFTTHLTEGNENGEVGLEVWEVKDTVKIEKTKLEVDPEDEEEEEPEEIETKERVVEKESFLGSLKLPVVGMRVGKKKKGPLEATIMVTFIVAPNRSVE